VRGGGTGEKEGAYIYLPARDIINIRPSTPGRRRAEFVGRADTRKIKADLYDTRAVDERSIAGRHDEGDGGKSQNVYRGKCELAAESIIRLPIIRERRSSLVANCEICRPMSVKNRRKFVVEYAIVIRKRSGQTSILLKNIRRKIARYDS